MNDGLRVAEMDFDDLIDREWLATNALGGYASSTAPGMNTRRYHGLLVASMAPPVRRMVLLSRIEETLRHDGREFYLSCNEYPGTIWPRGHEHLRAFSAEPFPRWAYQGDGWTLVKHLRLLRGENTVLISYTLLGGGREMDLEVRPLLALRGIHELSYQWNGRLLAEQRSKGHWRVPATGRTPEIFFAHDGTFDRRPSWYLNTIYRREMERGYGGLEDLWSPGAAYVRLAPGQAVHFACSAEPFDLHQVVGRAERQFSAAGGAMPAAPQIIAGESALSVDPTFEALRHATDAYVLTTPNGDSPGCSVRYPWNAPSPRVALMGYAGLFLVPGRFAEARSLLLALPPHLEGGLLPSEFPEDGAAPVYGGADVSLWFVNAVWQYLQYTADEAAVRRHLLEPVLGILEHYYRGTSLGIHADPDGLLISGAPGVGVTWMDAKAGEWVVTPRQGRAVEVNALWYNAICIAAELSRRFDLSGRGERWDDLAASIREAFNDRFWNDAAGCCYDVVGGVGADASIRPNQLLAVSLPFPVLDAARHAAVIDKVRSDLLTPLGVRTLAPSDPNYQGHYAGGVVERDRAYHNGSAYPWLLGPLVTGLLRVRGTSAEARLEARLMLEPCLVRLRGDGLGQLCELFDGDAPHHPGGALASPTAVGEILRCYAEDILGRAPSPASGAPGASHADTHSVRPPVSHNA